MKPYVQALLARFRWPATWDRRAFAIGAVLFACSGIVFRWAHQQLGFWTIDDAGITYAAAYELADHGSLAASVEGTPVESYSNPLLFFVVVVLRLVGLFDPVRTHVHLEMIVFATMVTLVWSMLRAWTSDVAAIAAACMFAAIELLTPATWTWYRSGLENVWVSCGIVVLLWSAARTSRGVPLTPWAGVAAFLVAITRPEAPAYVIAYFIALIALARPATHAFVAHLKNIAVVAAVTVGLYLVFLCWRRVGYGDWWPNTYYAKITGNATLGSHFREYVLVHVFRYGWSIAFALSVIAVLANKLETVARIIVVFLLAALTLPVTAGADWMGEHRFATSFFAVAHIAFASVFAVCVERVVQARAGGLDRRKLGGAIFGICVVLTLPALLLAERNPLLHRIPINEVTLGHIAHGQGGLRWEHQMRLGVPYAVVMLPDAGGALLVGGMQFMDSAALADFQQARIIKYGATVGMTLVNQYQHEERRPDLIHFNPNSATVDMSYQGSRYLANETHLAARRDLVEVEAIDAAAKLLFDTPSIKVYLSPETVQRAAPGALVRCELVLAWTGPTPNPSSQLRLTIDGDEDVVSLAPYQLTPPTPGAMTIERRGMLVGAPPRAGTYPVTLELLLDGQPARSALAFQLQVSADASDLTSIAATLVRDVSPVQAVRRIAWLREQQLPRLSTKQFRRLMTALIDGRINSGSVGRYITKLRWNARLAAFADVPTAIRNAEIAARRRFLSTCPVRGTGDDALAIRVGCLGRAIDQLRRLGYLGTLEAEAAIANELSAVRDQLDGMTLPNRYRMLLGLSLADPSEIDLQRALFDARRALAASGYPK